MPEMTEEQRGAIIELAAYNEDWIKTPKNRESERKIHEKLQKEREES
jgi:hypothetical protein